jgi:hypothetical protein
LQQFFVADPMNFNSSLGEFVKVDCSHMVGFAVSGWWWAEDIVPIGSQSVLGLCQEW